MAFRFVLLIGIANMFADFTYEGGRSITGLFLGMLGASGTIIGVVAGFAELMGYCLRSCTGYFADKTRNYWLMAGLGYCVNMLAVPALALAGNWPAAAVLIVVERTGRALRKPAVETMLSYSGDTLGSGWVFGFNEALDQAGATIGPLVVALILYLKGSYRDGFACLLISGLLCLITVFVAKRFADPLKDPQQDLGLDRSTRRSENLDTKEMKKFSKAYWLYMAASALIAAGFADFALIAFHFQKHAIVPNEMVPGFYALAMATAGIAALILGRLFDKVGSYVIPIAFLLGAAFAPLVFAGKFYLALLGMVLWGLSLGAQESLLKAVLVKLVPKEKRGTAFGGFDTAFGVAWFLGSAAMGCLYDRSIPALIIFSVVLQLAALPIFALATKAENP